MKNLVRLLVKENTKNKFQTLQSLKEVKDPDSKKLPWFLSQYLTRSTEKKVFNSVKDLKQYLKSRIILSYDKGLKEKINKLSFAPDLIPIEKITITVNWKKSQIWRSNPTAETFIHGLGHLNSGSIGGCGYDKESTAVAMVLNQIPQFIRLMYELKNKKSKISNRELLGYGSGYGILPSFEGGVGVSCYDRIFNSIGYKFETISCGKNFDVYTVSKVTPKVQREKKTKLYNYSN